MKKLNHKGFSLVAVMIAALIGMLIIVTMNGAIVNLFNAQRSISSKDATRDIVSEIRLLLADPAACATNFAGSNPKLGGFTKSQLTDSTGTVVKFTTNGNASYSDRLVSFSGFKVKNYQPDVASVPLVGKADLILKMKKVGTEVGGADMQTTIRLQTNLNAGNAITSCYSLVGDDSIWKHSPMNAANIFYDQGNVGIGTDNPSSRLQIVLGGDLGEAYFGNTADMGFNGGVDSVFYFNNSGAAAGKTAITSSSSGTELLTVTNTGNVGVGNDTPQVKLDVNGGIKVGNTGTCNTNLAGTIRYNAGNLEFCDGTAWRSTTPPEPKQIIGPSLSCGQTGGSCDGPSVATCPAKHKLYGGGAEILGPSTGGYLCDPGSGGADSGKWMFIQYSKPSGNAWHVLGNCSTYRAYAMCVPSN